MAGVTLRYKWITWAMFILFRPKSPSSHQGGYHKKCIHITPGSGSLVGDKNPQSVVYY